MNARRLAGAIIATVLIAPILGCATLSSMERPEIQAVRPRISGIDFQGINLAFDVDVNNPYPLPIKTPRFRYGIDIEGSRFLDSKATSQLSLPANGVGMVTLPVRLSYRDLFRTYQQLADASEANYGLHGALILPFMGRSFEVPVSHSGTFPILRPPTFSDIEVDLAQVSLIKTKISANAQMKNPNAFTLGIEDLGYVLKLGDIELGNLTATTGSTLDAGQTGRLSLTGEASAASALFSLIKGGSTGKTEIAPSGSIKTPYGAVKFRTDS